jgi:hypothetical protein
MRAERHGFGLWGLPALSRAMPARSLRVQRAHRPPVLCRDGDVSCQGLSLGPNLDPATGEERSNYEPEGQSTQAERGSDDHDNRLKTPKFASSSTATRTVGIVSRQQSRPLKCPP